MPCSTVFAVIGGPELDFRMDTMSSFLSAKTSFKINFAKRRLSVSQSSTTGELGYDELMSETVGSPASCHVSLRFGSGYGSIGNHSGIKTQGKP